MVPTVNLLMETYYMADGVPRLLTWWWRGIDVAIKTLLKKLFSIFKCHISILINKKLKQKKFNSSILILTLKNKKQTKILLF